MNKPNAISLPGITLTREQEEILDTLKGMSASDTSSSSLIRITAAAGAGKTTTLLALALHAAQLGHKHITYLTFTRASADDGKTRLYQALHEAGVTTCRVEARTLHSCAAVQLKNYQPKSQEEEEHTGRTILWTEKRLHSWISKTWDNEIEEFLAPCYAELHRRQNDNAKSAASLQSRKRTARDRVEFFLFKSLNLFCSKALTRDEYENPNLFGRDYYPAKKFHQNEKDSLALGFQPRIYRSKIGWYADPSGSDLGSDCAAWHSYV